MQRDCFNAQRITFRELHAILDNAEAVSCHLFTKIRGELRSIKMQKLMRCLRTASMTFTACYPSSCEEVVNSLF